MDDCFRSVAVPMPRKVIQPDDNIICSQSETTGTQNIQSKVSELNEILVSEIIEIKQKLINLEAQNRVMILAQDKMIALISSNKMEANMELDDDLTLPINDEAQLSSLDQTLQSKEKRRRLSSVLSICSSETVAATTRSIMKKTISNNLAKRMNWAGKGSCSKIPFSRQEHLLKVIYGKHHSFTA